MRILGVNLQVPQEASCAEVFLKFSPRVQFRFPTYVFIDIESTTHLFGGEEALLQNAKKLAESLHPEACCAIADTAPSCQILLELRPSVITRPGFDYEVLNPLPIQSLKFLEGLKAWRRVTEIEHVISFFQMLGIQKLQEVMHFNITSFRERWGDLGVDIWNRLHQKERQVISPLERRDPLYSYIYFDEPVSAISHLQQKMDPALLNLFVRLEGLQRFAQRLHLTLFCEYSELKHSISIEPISPSRDAKLFLDLLVRKLDSLDLDNPIRDIEIEIQDVPEKTQQLDLFAVRDQSEDRWRRLISFVQQSSCEMGFLQQKSSHFPEDSFDFKSDWPKDFSPKDLVHFSDKAIQVKAVYAKGLAKSPRPSLLLKEPLPLPRLSLAKLQMLSRYPSERIESSWWDFRKNGHKERDYYFAANENGQLLWIYQDRLSKQYFLHGYFD